MGEAFTTQEDAFQEHHHDHSHGYLDRGDDRWEWYEETGGDSMAVRGAHDYVKTTTSTNLGTILSADKVHAARYADETRPKNMKVVYLMKCWHN